MLRRISHFLNRPMSADFSFRTQLISSLQSGGVIFVLLLLFANPQFVKDRSSWYSLLLILTGGVFLAAFVAGYVVPKLFPAFYDENRWTVWKYGLHVPMLLLLVSISNQLVLMLSGNDHPSFRFMYLNVLLFGIFPISLDILLTEQRRLRRNLAHAQTLNEQLAHQPASTLEVIPPSQPDDTREPVKAISPLLVLTSESGKERLSLLPDQLRYIESVGNYVEVHWLNTAQPQKTVLRSTLKEIAEEVAVYPAFFRCHRAFLINLKAVRQTEGNARGYQLTLDGVTEKIPVSRGYLNAFDTRISSLL